MEKNVLQSIDGVAVYPLISFAIFFFFFLGLALYVLVASRHHINTMSQLPLLDDAETIKANLNHDVLC
jgi:hypothetical protein